LGLDTYKMGAGYSIVDGNIEISKERMKNIYAKYSDPSAYDAWKKQLEDAAKQPELRYAETITTSTSETTNGQTASRGGSSRLFN